MMAYSQMVVAAEARQSEFLRETDKARLGRSARVAPRSTEHRMPRAAVVSILGLIR
jgi:hypothetical protein